MTAAATLHVLDLWRYPVKSLGGERLTEVDVGLDGIAGDRLVHVRGPEGIRTARRYHRLLGLRGTIDATGRPLVNGFPWDSDEALALVRAASGDDAWLEVSDGPERFDVLPLLIATDGAVSVFGRDVRRLRPNIVIGGVAGLAERQWPGVELRIADLVVQIDSLRGRCVVTTVDPDSLERDSDVLRDIVRRFGGRLALNASLSRGGTIHVGDTVQLAQRARVAITA
jgi:uncharacterized protein YcbX